MKCEIKRRGSWVDKASAAIVRGHASWGTAFKSREPPVKTDRAPGVRKVERERGLFGSRSVLEGMVEPEDLSKFNNIHSGGI